jgi:hypothetical protein
MLVSFGKKTVTTAGTIVQVTTTPTNLNGLVIQALAANTGQIYVGLSNLVKSTLVGCLYVIGKPPTAFGELPRYIVQSGVSVAPVDLSVIWLDSDVSGEGVLISYLVA